MLEPKVNDSIFDKDKYVTDIGAIISHHPFKVFGRNGKKYIIKWTNNSNGVTNIQIVKELE